MIEKAADVQIERFVPTLLVGTFGFGGKNITGGNMDKLTQRSNRECLVSHRTGTLDLDILNYLSVRM